MCYVCDTYSPQTVVEEETGDNDDVTSLVLYALEADTRENTRDVEEEQTPPAMSLKQTQRLRRQALTILSWLTRRTEQLSKMSIYLTANPDSTLRDFYSAHPTLTIEQLVTATCTASGVSIKTFRKWRKQFVSTGKFKRCERGLAQFGWLLVNNDKTMELTHWRKAQKQMSVAETRDWINDTLLADFPVGRIANYGRLQRPIGLATAHRWMLNCGCRWEPVSKSYMTDSHEKHSTLLYRLWFCDLDYFLSLRMHRWACFSKSALVKLKTHFKDKWPHDCFSHQIPIEDVGKFPPGSLYI